MTQTQTQKPTAEEWLSWAQVVIDRLTTCVHVYSKPPYPEVFMPEADRQNRNAKTLDLLRLVHALVDEAETLPDQEDEMSAHDETSIQTLLPLLVETLKRLPELSTDMQLLMKSRWDAQCNGRVASELFCGPSRNEKEGIGTGHPTHGRLPEVLKNLLEREHLGDSRQPREIVPHRAHDERKAAQSGRFLRSAGRID